MHKIAVRLKNGVQPTMTVPLLLGEAPTCDYKGLKPYYPWRRSRAKVLAGESLGMTSFGMTTFMELGISIIHLLRLLSALRQRLLNNAMQIFWRGRQYGGI